MRQNAKTNICGNRRKYQTNIQEIMQIFLVLRKGDIHLKEIKQLYELMFFMAQQKGRY